MSQWAVLIVYVNGDCSLLREAGRPQRVWTFDKRTALVNASMVRGQRRDDEHPIQAAVAVRHPLVLR